MSDSFSESNLKLMTNEEHIASVNSGTFIIICSGETYSTQIAKGSELTKQIMTLIFGEDFDEPEQQRDQEESIYDQDNWSHDADFGATHYAMVVGEIDSINIYRLTHIRPA